MHLKSVISFIALIGTVSCSSSFNVFVTASKSNERRPSVAPDEDGKNESREDGDESGDNSPVVTPTSFDLTLLGTEVDPEGFTIQWSLAENADSYVVVICNDAACSDVVVEKQVSALEYFVDNLTPGTYFLKVIAKNSTHGTTREATASAMQLKVLDRSLFAIHKVSDDFAPTTLMPTVAGYLPARNDILLNILGSSGTEYFIQDVDSAAVTRLPLGRFGDYAIEDPSGSYLVTSEIGNLVRLNLDSLTTTTLAPNPGDPNTTYSNASFSMDGSVVAVKHSGKNVLVARTDGTAHGQVPDPDDGFSYESYFFTADAQYLVLSAKKSSAYRLFSYHLSTDTTTEIASTFGAVYPLNIGPRVLYTSRQSTSGSQLFVANLTTGVSTRISGFLSDDRNVTGVSVTADDTKIVITTAKPGEAGQVYATDINATYAVLLSGSAPIGTSQAISWVAITPDGSHVVFISSWDIAGKRELFSTSIDGISSPQKISAALDNGHNVINFAISPDSNHVAYVVSKSISVRELHVVGLDGSSDKLVHPANKNTISYSFTPDGTRLWMLGNYSSAYRQIHFATLADADPAAGMRAVNAAISFDVDSHVVDDGKILLNYPDGSETAPYLVDLATEVATVAGTPQNIVLWGASQLQIPPQKSHAFYVADFKRGFDEKGILRGYSFSAKTDIPLTWQGASKPVIKFYGFVPGHARILFHAAEPFFAKFEGAVDFDSSNLLELVTAKPMGLSTRFIATDGTYLEFATDLGVACNGVVSGERRCRINLHNGLEGLDLGPHNNLVRLEYYQGDAWIAAQSAGQGHMAGMRVFVEKNGSGVESLYVSQGDGSDRVAVIDSFPVGAAGVDTYRSSSDMSKIVFSSDHLEAGVPKLFVYSVSEGTTTQVNASSGVSYRNLTWLNNETSIAMEGFGDTSEVRVVSVDDNSTLLVSDPGTTLQAVDGHVPFKVSFNVSDDETYLSFVMSSGASQTLYSYNAKTRIRRTVATYPSFLRFEVKDEKIFFLAGAKGGPYNLYNVNLLEEDPEPVRLNRDLKTCSYGVDSFALAEDGKVYYSACETNNFTHDLHVTNEAGSFNFRLTPFVPGAKISAIRPVSPGRVIFLGTFETPGVYEVFELTTPYED